MYIPKAFREDDLETLHAFMREYSFATLVTQQNGELVASHLPFLFDAERGSYGTLMGHMARGNSQWRTFAEMQEALVIFQGPHTYISPSWYEDDLAASVPTWNYAVVHAYGIPRLIEDDVALYTMLQALVEKHEAQFEKQWTFKPLDEYMQKRLRAIVGFEIPITRLEGKFKMSQNRSTNDQGRVIVALEGRNADQLSTEVAELMSKRRRDESG